ncbi:MAG: cupin domain-containing protein [Hyphomonadaceae bacterium]|nr:cupin domain-containing protein [Hyphomonadaceae bacterium]MBX3510875.1 cupin domain-containing protein [Hyphomonadaceae bacterium]
MSNDAFAEAMRRVVTGEDSDGRSLVIVDGAPAGAIGDPALGGLFEIWHEAVSGAFNKHDTADRGEARPILSPSEGKVKVRWFVIAPLPDGAPPEMVKPLVRQRFAEFGAEHELTNQDRHPAMHKTETLDIICLIQGEASLILDNEERRLKPGNIVIQRGTSHGWTAHGGPALFLAVLIDRHA